MHEGITKAVILIGDLKAKWDTLPQEIKTAIHQYEWSGARFEIRDAFEEENYHDIAEAIHNEIWGRA
jgi:hypothetical protein